MKKILASLLLAVGTALVAAPVSAAIIVRFLPQQSHVEVGESTEVQMWITGLDDEILTAFDVRLLFDEAILRDAAVAFTGQAEMGGGDALLFDSIGVGSIDATGFSLLLDLDPLLANQANDFVVLTFSFTGNADGFSFVNLGPDLNFERNFVGLAALSPNVTVIGACIAVGTGECAQVPEPSTMSLLMLAFAGAFMVRARRRRIG